jgi:hypothetical protein
MLKANQHASHANAWAVSIGSAKSFENKNGSVVPVKNL